MIEDLTFCGAANPVHLHIWSDLPQIYITPAILRQKVADGDKDQCMGIMHLIQAVARI